MRSSPKTGIGSANKKIEEFDWEMEAVIFLKSFFR